MPDSPARALVAEAIGTFTLCFIGILAINAGSIAGLEGLAAIPNLSTVALAHGLAILVMVAALGAVSGGHFNPAVTFGFMITRRMTPARGLMYWGAQIGGALLASLVIGGAFGGGDATGPAIPSLHPEVTGAGGVILEAVATFFLVLVVFGTAVDERAPKSVFPIAIGLTVAMDIMAIGPLTGAAMNPARVLGPALATQIYGSIAAIEPWAAHWVYWVGPLLGAAAAALLMHHFILVHAPDALTGARGGPSRAEARDVA